MRYNGIWPIVAVLLLSGCAHSEFTAQEVCAFHNQVIGDLGCRNPRSDTEVKAIQEDRSLYFARQDYDEKIAQRTWGVGLFSAGYIAAILGGVTAQSSTEVSIDPKTSQIITNTHEPGKLFLIPLIGPLLELQGQTTAYKENAVFDVILQAAGAGLILYSWGAIKPDQPKIRIVPSSSGGMAQLDVRF